MNSRTKELINYIKSTTRSDNKASRSIQSAIIEEVSQSAVFDNAVSDILVARADTTPPHVLSIIVQGVIHAARKKYAQDKIDKFNPKDWNVFVKKLSGSPQLLSEFCDYAKKENSHIFVLNRYSSFKLACQIFFANRPIDVLDVGASFNAGFPALEAGIEFENLDRSIVDSLSKRTTEAKLNFKESLSIDVEDRNLSLDKSLEVATTVIGGNGPKLIDTLLKFSEKSKNVFLNTDVGKFLLNNNKKFDAVFASNVLYQLNSTSRSVFFSRVKSLLKEGGILVVNDYLKDLNTVEWVDDWSYGGKVNYRSVIYQNKGTNMVQYDFLSWDSSQCNLAVKSKDFDVTLT